MNRTHVLPRCVHAIDPVEIAEVIDRLGERINADGNADILGPWAVARLGAKLGLSGAASVSDDPVGAVSDLGGQWAEAIRVALDHLPAGEVPEVLRRAMDAIQGVVQDVTRRGLAG